MICFWTIHDLFIYDLFDVIYGSYKEVNDVSDEKALELIVWILFSITDLQNQGLNRYMICF